MIIETSHLFEIRGRCVAALEAVDDGLLLLDLIGDDPLRHALATGSVGAPILSHIFDVGLLLLRIQLWLLCELR